LQRRTGDSAAEASHITRIRDSLEDLSGDPISRFVRYR
jgi:hypothetical protein